MGQEFRVVLDGRPYVWDGRGWYGAADFNVPTEAVRLRLDGLLPPGLRPPAPKAKGPRPA